MNKKKLLVFTDWYLPAYKAGGPVRSIANIVAHLKDEIDSLIIEKVGLETFSSTPN